MTLPEDVIERLSRVDDDSLRPADRDLFQALASTLRGARADTRLTARRILVLHARSSNARGPGRRR